MSDDDDYNPITPELNRQTIAKLEALIDVYRKSGQHEQAEMLYRRLAMIKGLIPVELDLPEDLPDELPWLPTRPRDSGDN